MCVWKERLAVLVVKRAVMWTSTPGASFEGLMVTLSMMAMSLGEAAVGRSQTHACTSSNSGWGFSGRGYSGQPVTEELQWEGLQWAASH